MGDEAKTSERDAELVRLARRGDKQAFVEIVARHQAMVCGVALGILGDFSASEDAAQEAFLTAWRRFSDLREPDRLRPWLGKITRNTALAHLRRRRGGEPLESVRAYPDASPPPDESAAWTEETRLVRDALEQLPETYRLPLVLYYRESKSVRAVADSLEISEDAAKKRLERGREMLREKLSGLVESVLTRTAPSAVFTMTIAAAIGALTAPAAVAGGVYAATTATAGTTTATQSLTTTLTAMSASKPLLVTTALVAAVCVPIGYQLPPATASAPLVVSKKKLPVVTKTKPKSGSVVLTPESELFREWQRLHDLHGRSPGSMPAIHAAIDKLNGPFQRRAFHTALVAEWVELDPAGAFEFFSAKGRDSGQRRMFLREWLKRDPNAAVDALLAGKKSWHGLARRELKRIAELVPSRLPELAAALPGPRDIWDRDMVEAFALLADRDLAAVRKSAEQMSGPNRDQALAGVAAAWARRDWNAALKWARGLPEGVDRDEVVRSGLVALAGVNPIAALDQMGIVPPAGRRSYHGSTTAARVLKAAAKVDFDGTLAWLAEHPGRLGTRDLGSLSAPVTRLLNTDAAEFLTRRSDDGSLGSLLPAIRSGLLNSASGQLAAVWDWTQAQSDSPDIETLRECVLMSAGYRNPDLAMQLAAKLPDTAKSRDDARKTASSLWNGGQNLHRFDGWYEQAPEHFRPHLASAAFQMLGPETISNPQTWIDRLPQVADSDRQQATVSLAHAWARRNPEEAVDWALSLPHKETRQDALLASTSAWAREDAHGAATWINTLPPGEERDRSTSSLVKAVVERQPVAAWEWAMSVQSENERMDLAARVVRSVAKSDISTARQWITDGPFSAAQRAQLLDGLNNPQSAAGNGWSPTFK